MIFEFVITISNFVIPIPIPPQKYFVIPIPIPPKFRDSGDSDSRFRFHITATDLTDGPK